MKWQFQLIARNGLARRTFVVLAAAVCVIVLGVVAFATTWSSRYVRDEMRREISVQAKQYGLGVFQRLELATLALISADESAFEASSLRLYFDRIDVVRGAATTPDVASSETEPPQLRVKDQSDALARIEVLHRSASGLVIATVAGDYLWQPDTIPSNVAIVVSNASGLNLFEHSPGALGAEAGDEDFELVATWDLFLRERFGAEPWRIRLVSDLAARGESLANFRFLLFISLLPLLAGMAWLASVLVRRSHRPLEQLIAATRVLASGRFDAHVAETGDADSRALIKAFNEMTDRIALQWRAMQLWSRIDSSILGAADFDAVTSASLRQAREILKCEALALLAFEAPEQAKLVWNSEQIDASATAIVMPALPAGLREGHCVRICAADPEWDTWSRVWQRDPTQCLQLTAIREGALVRGVIISSRSASRPVDVDGIANQQHLSERLAVALAKFDRDAALVRNANIDELTQLANRRHLQQFLDAEVKRCSAARESFAFLFLDLDRFKLVNDAIGHAVGDRVLRAVAEKLKACLPQHFIARLGGDEFTIVMPDATDLAAVAQRTELILAALAEPIEIGGHAHVVAASIGIAVFPDHGEDASALMRNADVAMYHAKRSQTLRYAFYESSMSIDALQQVVLETELRSAVANGELVIHYQPQLDIRTGLVVGTEALLRWKHPRLGTLAPEQFLAIAEQTGLIVPIGEWVLDAVCRQYRQWRNEGVEITSIAINASVAQLMAARFVPLVAAALDAHHVPRGVLEIEITETAIATDIQALARTLTRLRELGVAIAIDDFGVGYSSLTYLRHLPFDVLKIDRAFMPVTGEPGSGALCEIIIGIAATLHKDVIAEGVETAEHIEFLRGCGCYVAQGFYYARPLGTEAFASFVRERADLQAAS